MAAEKEEEYPAEEPVRILSGEEWTDRRSDAAVRKETPVPAAAVKRKGMSAAAVAVRKNAMTMMDAAVWSGIIPMMVPV